MITMAETGLINKNSIEDWIRKFNPEKRILTGRSYLFAKRMFDLTVVILASPFWVPVLLLIAIMIWIDSPGASVVFFQNRTGRDGKRFRMYKFRSMVPNAEELKQEYMHLNELQWPDFKITNDPRVTRIGRILRKTSMDELPQLINIVKGDMSLVGPRPTSFGSETYKLWHTERLDVLPGVTGLWQVFGRASMEFDDRLRLDIAYIERRSLWFDFIILLKTVTAVFESRGAH
jgi:lipopolysaccharide/colanic/teichoic acid biosynthesis glycosyltransferase